MAKKTLEAKLRMVDETQSARRTAAAGLKDLTGEYAKLDKAMKQAASRTAGDRRMADQTLDRQRINNLEREVQLGRQGASLELEKARATAAYRREREALLRVMKNEAATMHQRAAAEQQLINLNMLHLRNQARISAGGGVAPAARQGMFSSAAAGLASRFAPMAIGYAGMNVANTIEQRQDESMKARVDFEKSLTELFAVGNNSRNIDALRKKVLHLSAASGRPTAEIAELLSFIDQGMPTQSQHEKEEMQKVVMKLGKISNARMSSWAEALIKGMGQFGGEVSGVGELADKFQKTIDLGFVTPEQFAEQAIRPIIAGGSMGFKLDEILGFFAAATLSSKNAQVAATALSNIFLKMNEEVEKGVKLTGSLEERFNALAKIHPEIRTELFGSRNATTLSGTIKLLGTAKDFTQQLGTVAGDTDKKLSAMGQNFTRAIADINAGLKNMQENMKLGYMGGEDASTHYTLREASRTYVKSTPVGEALPEWAQNRLADLDGLMHGNRGGARALLTQAQEKFDAGDIEGARQSFELANSTGTLPPEIVARWRQNFGAELKKKALTQSMDATGNRIAAGRGSSAAAAAHVKLAEYLDARASRGFYDPKDHDSIQVILAKIKENPEKAKDLDPFLKEAKDNEWSISRQLEHSRAQAVLNTFLGSKTGRKAVEAVQKFDIKSKWETIIGEGKASLVDKLMGVEKKGGTLPGVIGGLLHDGATSLLGQKGSAFFGLTPGLGGSPSAKFDHLRPQSGMWSQGSGIFQDLAGQRKVQDEMRRDWKEIKDNTKTMAEALEIMKKIWGSMGVLNISGV